MLGTMADPHWLRSLLAWIWPRISKGLVPSLATAAKKCAPPMVVLLGPLLAGTVIAEPFPELPTWTSGQSSESKDFASLDFDADGDLDLFITDLLYVRFYRNHAGEFIQEWTYDGFPKALAAGDLDGDGYPDAVVAFDGALGVLRNIVGTTVGFWPTVPITDRARDLALADIDGDGDLDVVAANEGPNSLASNADGALTTGVWTSDSSRVSHAVSIGDIDQNGYPDAIFANAHENTLYLNQNGVLPTQPSWTSSDTLTTVAVALGDLDGDGDLDAICANQNGPNAIYENLGQVFATDPLLLSSGPSQGVAVADLDGDEDLDVVFANAGFNVAYENTGGLFEESVLLWASAFPDVTVSVGLIDLDDFGGPDLLCLNAGENGQVDVIYHHQGVFFSTQPVWRSSLPDRSTQAIAVGDLDNDGDLDVVFGNGLPTNSNTIYLNDGGQLVLDWTEPEGEARQTSSVALGFVDEDEYLDIVAGSANDAEITVYRSAAGVFPAVASQRILGPNAAGVLMSELFGGGSAELVSANLSPPPGNTVYQTSGGLFDPTPVWTSLDGFDSRAVASADFDRDGDNDLAFANRLGTGQQNSVYLNEGGQLEERSSWVPEGKLRSEDVEAADFDGDGYPDLVFANWDQNDTVYLNGSEDSGGLILFETQPTWSSLFQTASSSVATGDLDADGDIDLVFGNAGADLRMNSVYLNLARGDTRFQGFGSAPAWRSSEENLTLDVALADLDEDGDLDLICGNSGANTVYDGRRNHDSSRTTGAHGVSNTTGMLYGVRASRADGSNIIQVDYTAVDTLGDPMNIGVEYAFVGERNWTSAEVVEGNPLLSVPSSAQGTSGSFQWDTSRVPFDGRQIVLRLKTTEVSTQIAETTQARSYLHTLAISLPSRPFIRTDAELSFPVVSVGDTVTARLEVQNVGTGELELKEAIIQPVGEVETLTALPLQIAARSSAILDLRYAPRQSTDQIALQIQTNDPNNEITTVVLNRDVRLLEFSVEAFVPGSAPLGEAVTFAVLPFEHVRIESAQIVHRSRGSTVFADSVAATRANTVWSGAIPAEFITERGLSYYVRVSNSGFSATLPANAPEEFFDLDVAPPDGFSTSPVGNADEAFVEGEDIVVELDLHPGTEPAAATLFYRVGGRAPYDSVAVELSPVPKARIPGNVVGTRGIEYWVSLETVTGIQLKDPPTSPEDSPRIIQTDVESLSETRTHPGFRYRMLSVPLELDAGRTIQDILAEQAEFGPYQLQPPRNWRSFRYLAEQDETVEFDPAAVDLFEVKPGIGFWLISRTSHAVDTAPVDGRSVPTDRFYPIVLGGASSDKEKAWSQFGNPFNFPVEWDAVQRSEFVGEPVAYDPNLDTSGNYSDDDVRVLMPFEAYFIANSSSEPETLLVPPIEASAALVASVSPLGTRPSGHPAKNGTGAWSLSLTARTAQAAVTNARLGVRGDARSTWDRHDRLKPPSPPGPWVRVSFPHPDWGGHSGFYRHDLREMSAEGHRWDIVLQSESRGEEVILQGWKNAQLPEGLSLTLVDVELGSMVDLTQGIDAYHVLSFGPDRQYRLALMAGTEDYVTREANAMAQVPQEFVLAQNAPNPFNPATRIRFGLPRSSRVRLDIYSIRGERIFSLLDGNVLPAGYHSYVWNGHDMRGQRVASGVYFYRLVTEEKTMSKKMVLMQ